MNFLQEALIQSILSATNEADLFDEILRAAEKLGFEYCAYGMLMPLPISKPKLFMVNNYTQEWQRQYIHNDYLAIDPSVAHGMRSIAPLMWTDNIFSACRSFWEEAQAHGLRIGWAQSCYDSKGVGGLLTLARSNDILSPRELGDISLKMLWLTQAVHIGMSRLLVPKFMPESAAELSKREIEVLRWTAEAKTSSEVGEILNIAERTVNFHVNNAMVKLGVANKTAAAIKVAVLRLL